MSIRKIKQHHYAMLRRAKVYDWGMDSLFQIMCEGQKRIHSALMKVYEEAIFKP